MEAHDVVSRQKWLNVRKGLLAKEKQLTRLRDEVSAERRKLPWVRIDKEYQFEGPDGRVGLADLFGPHSQLIVYHFMFAPDWEAGCKSCSFWADNFNGIISHLNARDVAFAAISRAPLEKLSAFAKRLGWTFQWVSSGDSDFNFDYQVSFTPENLAAGEVTHNFRKRRTGISDLPGVSVFARGEDGALFHTYSSYERGIDILNNAYNYLDLVPKGRDEEGLDFSMTWVRLHDEYDH